MTNVGVTSQDEGLDRRQETRPNTTDIPLLSSYYLFVYTQTVWEYSNHSEQFLNLWQYIKCWVEAETAHNMLEILSGL